MAAASLSRTPSIVDFQNKATILGNPQYRPDPRQVADALKGVGLTINGKKQMQDGFISQGGKLAGNGAEYLDENALKALQRNAHTTASNARGIVHLQNAQATLFDTLERLKTDAAASNTVGKKVGGWLDAAVKTGAEYFAWAVSKLSR